MIAALGVALLQAGAIPAPPLVAWSVEPESVTVAEPFRVIVRVRAPRDVTVVFPAGPDSAQVVEAVDPPATSVGEDSAGMTERRATYRLVAWETGRLTVLLAPVTVGLGRTAQRLDVRPEILVASVLPTDSAKTKMAPRPALGVIDSARAWWAWALGAVLAIAALGWLERRRRTRRAARRPPPPPLAVAEEALTGVDALGLLEAGEPSRYVRLYADALRGYLSARVAGASRAQTTGELVAALRGRAIPVARVTALLAEADQVQFAHRPVSAARAREVAREVHALLSASDEAFARDVPVPPAPGRRAGRASPKRVA